MCGFSICIIEIRNAYSGILEALDIRKNAPVIPQTKIYPDLAPLRDRAAS